MAERTDETQSPFHPQALQSPALPAGGVVSPPSKLQRNMKGMLRENALLQGTSETINERHYSFYKRKSFLRLAIRQKNYKHLASSIFKIESSKHTGIFLNFGRPRNNYVQVIIFSVRESKLNKLDRTILKNVQLIFGRPRNN